MKRLLRNGWKSVATVVVLVGLVGGPAYAAGLAKNSVRSKHIKDGEVRTEDILDGTVSSADIGDNTITTFDIGDGWVRDTDLGLLTIRTNPVTVNAGSAATVSQSCLDGETAISVGSSWDGAATVGPVYIAQSNLTGTGGAAGAPGGGTVTGRNDGAGARTLTIQVLCLN